MVACYEFAETRRRTRSLLFDPENPDTNPEVLEHADRASRMCWMELRKKARSGYPGGGSEPK